MRSPRRSGAATREALVAAAAKRFNEVGYHGTDSNRIARAAGFAPATFYRHFADKRAIFLAVYREWLAAEWEGLRGEIARPGPAGFERVTRLVLDHHRRWAGFRRSLRALTLTDPAVCEARNRQRERQLRFMAELLPRYGFAAPSRAQCLFALLTFERVCDAIATGETAALGVPEAEMIRSLRDLLRGTVGDPLP